MATLPHEMIQEHTFNQFNLKSIDKKHIYALIFGCSGSGKSYLTKDLLAQLAEDGYWKEYWLVSPTEHLSHSFGCFERDHVKDAFDEAWLMNLINERVQKIRAKESIKPCLIVIDDCAADARIRHSPALNKLFISGRHLKIGCFLLLQNVNPGDSVPPALRANATLLATARPRKQKDRAYIVKEWFSMNSEREGEQVLLDLTSGDHNFAVADLQKFAKAERLEDFISQYHANKVPASFKLVSSGPAGGMRESKTTKKADVKVSNLTFI